MKTLLKIIARYLRLPHILCTKAFVAGAFILLSGCQSMDWGLEGNALLTKTIACPDYRCIEAALIEEMSALGYSPAGGHPQTTKFSRTSPGTLSSRLIGFFYAGQDSIWFIAQPEAKGWTLFCMVEPSHYDTHFPRQKLKRVLAQVENKCRS